MFSSIKAKVLIFYTFVLFLILVCFGVILYFTLQKIIFNSIDDALLLKAQALATLITNEDNGRAINFNFSDEIMWEYSSVKSKSYFQIRKKDGTIIEKSASLGKFVLPFYNTDKTTFYTIYLNKKPVRLVNFYFLGDERKPIIIQSAQVIEKEFNLLKKYKLALIVLIPLVVSFSSIGGLLIVKKAIKPVKNFSDIVEKVSEENLSERIDINYLPDELKILAKSFNRTFEKLEKAFKNHKQFIANASHELKTPLSVIMTECDVTLRKERNVEEYKKALLNIKNVVNLMSSMVKKLLILTQLTHEKIEFKKEKINLNQIIYEAISLLMPLSNKNSIQINVQLNETLLTYGNKALLIELFLNLLDNAIKYNKPNGTIEIFEESNAEFVVIKIKDSGTGIPEKELDRVFERFYRVDKSHSKKSEGTGLGLSICKEIVKLHQGEILLESKIGEGTTVTVLLKKLKK